MKIGPFQHRAVVLLLLTCGCTSQSPEAIVVPVLPPLDQPSNVASSPAPKNSFVLPELYLRDVKRLEDAVNASRASDFENAERLLVQIIQEASGSDRLKDMAYGMLATLRLGTNKVTAGSLQDSLRTQFGNTTYGSNLEARKLKFNQNFLVYFDLLNLRKLPNQSVEISKKSPAPAGDILTQMKWLVGDGQLAEAANIGKRQLATKGSEGCDGTRAYALYAVAQGDRLSQGKAAFHQRLGAFLSYLDSKNCAGRNLKMSTADFDKISIDTAIKIARFHWVQGDLPLARVAATRAYDAAEKANNDFLMLEAAQVLVGRIGFETNGSQENLTLLNRLAARQSQLEEVRYWTTSRKAMFLILDKKFQDASALLEQYAQSTADVGQKAFCYYWQGVALKQLGQADAALIAFQKSAVSEPNGVYDIWSGEAVGSVNLRLSTKKRSPFSGQVEAAFKRYMFAPSHELPIQKDAIDTEFFQTLSSTVAYANHLLTEGKFENYESFSVYLSNPLNVSGLLIKKEAQWLRNKRLENSKSAELPTQHIGWLLTAAGDYSNSITFSGQMKDSARDVNEGTYFHLYPQAYATSIKAAAVKCAVDENLLFAIARQESLFQPAIKSGAGAVGLLQLMPSTANAVMGRKMSTADLTDPNLNSEAGACYLKKLLVRYDNNMVYAVAAYNAGENAVDDWVKRRNKYDNPKIFIEFIPYAETKKYVQKVMRNYENYKWIYEDKTESESKLFGWRFLK